MNILICGAGGRMGRFVYASAKQEGINVVCGVDRIAFDDLSFPVYTSFAEVKEKVDVIIDFSSVSTLDSILDYATKNNVNLVLCTTGYGEEELAKIEKASQKIAIFRSANMSVGVNLLIDLVKKATSLLPDFDVEIIEKHHNQKIDAPSGTAIMLADAVKDVDGERFNTYGREGFVGKRQKKEIGIHAVRGGNIVGEHDVIFAGENETVTLSHKATDRSVFAKGAIKASLYINTKTKGIFNMQNLISEL